MEISKELINEVLQGDFKDCNTIDDKFVIICNNKLFAPKQGRMFHDTYNEAWKHFYSQTRWTILNRYMKAFAESHGYNNWWECKLPIDKDNRQIWEDFKSEIIENYGFKIIQWKDAKRDVCSKQ